jgi:TonB-dependent receptor
MEKRLPLLALLRLLLAALLMSVPFRAVAQTGATVTGQVSNAATQYFLDGAVVLLAGTNRAVTSDREGRFTLSGIPGTTATLEVSFPGLDSQQVVVSLQPGQTVVRNVELTAGIYKMEALRIVGDREGSAMAVTRQRAATNVKNVVATDAFGTQTEDNVGSFLQRLPGLSAEFSTGSVREVMVRGIDSNLNTVELDGVQLANNNSSGTNRFFDFLQASISMVESIEVTKAPTPDMPASSIGGSINMVTRTAFGRSVPRQFTYAVGFVHSVGRFGGRAEKGYEEPIKGYTPSLSLTYSDLLGKNRNVGLSLSISRNTAFGGSEDVLMNYEATTARPAFIRTFASRPVAVQGPHTRQNESVKLEFKLSESTVLTLNAVHNLYLEVNDTRAFNLQAANSRASYAPGFSEQYTQALQLPTTIASMTETSYDNISHNFRFSGSAVYKKDSWVVDALGSASFSSGIQNWGGDYDPYLRWKRKPKAALTISGLNNIGFIIDRRRDGAWPTVTQTAGADVYNLANYTTLTMQDNNRIADARIFEGRINARRNFALAVPAYVKFGGQIQRQERDRDYNYLSHTFTGPGGLGQFVDRRSWVNETISGVRQGPWADLLYVAQHRKDNPSQWTEDHYYRYSQKLLNQVDFSEEIRSAYVMGNVQIEELNILAGLRFEDTSLLANGPIRRVTPAEQARRTAWVGPVTETEGRRRAEAEFANRISNQGGYENVFPGIHFKYAARSGLVARASYSTSIGRAPIASLIPTVAVSDSAQTISLANTALKPQFSDNFDLNLEYYYEPVGLFSVSAFLKEVSGFIYTDSSQLVPTGPNNGFEGLYENYRISTTANGGSARYRGIEFSYQQQFTFLPGFLRGLGVNMNYTRLETEGDYGGTVATTQVAGFRPKTANVALSYQLNRFRFSAQANWVDTYLISVSTNAAAITYESPRTFVSAKFSYRATPRTTVYLNLDNITKEPVNNRYTGYSDRTSITRQLYPSVGFGVQGRF